jgi:uncharacterized protein YgbK (DUF1537 family)
MTGNCTAAQSAPSDLRLVFYADDFTGATDTLATLARAGQRVVLFLGVPSPGRLAQVGPQDCVGIAGASRSMPCRTLKTEIETVARHVAQWRPRIVHYKVCSTFDSSPQIGSIGLAVRTLREHLATDGFTPIVGGQPNLGRYCAFGNLFAAFEPGGPVFRLDRHPTMSRHPVTPMDEADLRRHLGRQGLKQLSLIAYPAYEQRDDALDSCVEDAIAAGADGVVMDVATPQHLSVVGRLLWARARQTPLLTVGSSVVEQALLTQWDTSVGAARPDALGSPVDAAPKGGPALVFSGSLSPRTQRQIQAATSYTRIPIAVDAILEGTRSEQIAVRDHIVGCLGAGRSVLAHWAGRAGAADAPRIDPARLARAGGRLLADVLRDIRPARLGISGGDTSSHCLQASGAWALSYQRTLEPGVALCRLHADDANLDGLTVMLKGGQMGSDGVFEALRREP